MIQVKEENLVDFLVNFYCMTADELMYERYKAGECTYEEYCDVCAIEECEPKEPIN